MKNMANNVASVSSELKTFSAQASTAPLIQKSSLFDAPDDPTVPSAPSDQPKKSEVSGLDSIPPLLPELDRKLYPNVRQWDNAMYNKGRKGGLKNEDEKPYTDCSQLASYMEDENGNQIPESTKSFARKVAREFFGELLERGSAPKSWSYLPLSITTKYLIMMETRFPFLRLCSNHWKAIQVGTNQYSQWINRAAGRKAAIDTKKTKGKGKAKASEVSSDVEVIDLDDSEENPSSVRKRPVDDTDNAPGPSKRPRIEDPQPSSTSTSLPRPTKTITQGQKVCISIYSD